MSDFLIVYFQFNSLLLLSYILWLLLTKITGLQKHNLPFQTQLKLARYLLLFLIISSLVLVQWKQNTVETLTTELSIPVMDFAQIKQVIFSTEDIIRLSIFDSGQNPTSHSIGIVEILFFGLLIQVIRFAWGLFNLFRIIKSASPWRKVGNIQILFSAQCGTPFSTRAFFSNHIVLPYSLLDSPNNLRIVIRHEVQHHRNGDLNWIMLMEALKLFCYWNPAAYLWKNQIECLQEYACDEAILQSAKVSQADYGNCLLSIATYQDRNTLYACSNMVPGFSYFTNHTSQLKRRIIMISTISSARKSVTKTLTQSMLLSLGIFATSVLVYAQTDETDEVRINGVLIPEWLLSTPDYVLELEDLEYSEEVADYYSKARAELYSDLPRGENESLDDYAVRIGEEYVKGLQIRVGLEAYAAGYERSYNEQEVRIRELEAENARLLDQNLEL